MKANDQNAFIRMPKSLIYGDKYRFLSVHAKLLYALMADRAKYFINGVRYLVSSRFESVEAEKKVTILDRIKKIMKSNIVQLRFDEVSDTIEDEYVYPTAGKENYAVEEN